MYTSLTSLVTAAASVSGTLDLTFETTAALELFKYSPEKSNDDNAELEKVGCTHAPDRFNALAWGEHGPSSMGMIAGGLTNGVVTVWDPQSLIKEESDDAIVPIATNQKHQSAVQGLDWNPTMTNLLASCGGDGQIFIWDMANAVKIYVPGQRVKTTTEGMTSVTWNKASSVPHILAGSLSGGSCEIWDLKNKKQVITFHDTKRCNMGGQHSLAWHPSEPTIIVQCCEDDNSPVALVWDLKHYAAPVAVLSGHKKGLTNVNWWKGDPSVIMTCSKDGTTAVWDSKTATMRSTINAVREETTLSADAPYHKEAVFAPLVRAHFATASSDGVVKVHSLVDPGPRESGRKVTSSTLGQAPEWLKRKCGVSFGFGGRLLRFNSNSKVVSIATVITDPELVQEATQMKSLCESPEELAKYCEEQSKDESRKESVVWKVLSERLGGKNEKETLVAQLGMEVWKDEDVSAEGTAEQTEEKKEPEQNATDIFDALGQQHDNQQEEAEKKKAQPEGKALWGDSEWEARAGRLACNGDIRGAWSVCGDAGHWDTALIIARELGNENEYQLCRSKWLASKKTCALAKGVVQDLQKDPTVLIETGSLSEWKSLAATALAWGGDRSKALLSRLAQRLCENNEVESGELCYLGANDLEGLASVWISKGNAVDTVRRMLCASRAMGVHRAPHNSRLAAHLTVLADTLASQGDMKGALYWLEQIERPSAAPAQIQLLYNRLVAANNPKQAAVQKTQQQQPARQHQHQQSSHPQPHQQQPQQAKYSSQYAVPPRPQILPNVSSAGGAQTKPNVPVFPPAVHHSNMAPVPTVPPLAAATPVPPPTAHAFPSVPAPNVSTAYSAPSYTPPSSGGQLPTAKQEPPPPEVNQKVVDACAKLSDAVEGLGAVNDQSAKLSEEVSKRIPALKTKLDSLANPDAVCALLESLGDALTSRDINRASELYTEAQQTCHSQLGSTGMLALKRCLDLLKKTQ